MSRIVVIAAVLLGLSVVGHAAVATVQTGRRGISLEERARRRARMEQVLGEKVGGMIARPNTQKGTVVYVNCQTRVPKVWIDELIAYFREETRFDIGYREGAFVFPDPKVEGNATLFVIDDERMPALLVAPENRWAFVNVARIAEERRPAFFEARVKKQLARGFAYLCGASDSQYPRALTRGIVDEADLDKNADYRLPVDLFRRFNSYMAPLGVTPEVLVTYRRACEEGWAPAPTNKFQQAVWDKVHAVPKNPMKIEFDPKRGR